MYLGKTGDDLASALNKVGGYGLKDFATGIRQDIAKATECAQKAGLAFDNNLTAVYHYRKHGAEFPQAIRKFGDRIDTYLGPVRDNLFNDCNLRENVTLSVST